MTARVDQFLPILIERDAVGQHALAVDDLLTSAGVETTIFAGSAEPALRGRVRPVEEWDPDPGAVALYHVATGSPIADELVARAPRLALDHHNITPPHHFARWSPEMAQQAAWGRRQLADLCQRAELGLADSAFNAGELAALGCGATAVAPILLDVDHLGGTDGTSETGETGVAAEPIPEAPGRVWLFVGRLAPNKAQHDVIRAFERYRREYDPGARLRLVGAPSPPSYEHALRRLVAALDLDGAVELTGSVSETALAAHYRAADVFVCLSRHEGFCVPILEAFHHDLPVVALGTSAVTETVGAGGIVLRSTDPALVAAAAHAVLDDPDTRAAVVARGRRRLADFAAATSSARFLEALAPLLERAG